MTGIFIIAWCVPLAGVIFISLAAFNIRWNVFLKAVHRGNPAISRIALTFDDGPHPLYTPQVMELLEKYGVKASFFCIGKHAAEHPHWVRKLHESGHVVGNHSYTHAPTIDFHTKAKWMEELRATDSAIVQAIGRTPRYFRPPYGVTTPHLARAIGKTGHIVVGWRIRPYDTLDRPPTRIVGTILRKTRPGDIILLHDTHDRIIPVLEQLLPELKKRGFEMVTVENLIQQQAYVED